MIKQLIKKLLGRDKFNSLNYWENRYAGGGNSGDGSYGRLSVFKADFINKFIEEKKFILLLKWDVVTDTSCQSFIIPLIQEWMFHLPLLIFAGRNLKEIRQKSLYCINQTVLFRLKQ